MTSSILLRRMLLFLACVCLLAGPVAAEGAGPVLGADGTILRVLEGTYGELFDAPQNPHADNSVLALETVFSDGSTVRHLVPGTGSSNSESSPSLVFDESSQRSWLLWEQRVNGIHPLLQLTSFDGEQFSELIQLNAGVFTEKGSPQLLVTRESGSQEEEAEGAEPLDRTVLHVTWWQAVPGAVSRKLYAPIVLENGVRGESIPVFDLSAFFAPGEGELDPLPASVGDLLTIRRGVHNLSTLVGFLDPRSGRLVSLELELVPRQLSIFAEKARLEIVIIGNRVRSRQGLANEVRDRLVDLDDSLHLASRIYLAERVAMLIEATEDDPTESEENLVSMAEKARLEIVIIGSGIDTHGIDGSHQAFFLDIDGDLEEGTPTHLLEAWAQASFPAPPVPEEATRSRLFLSASGEEALVAWEIGNRIVYRETFDGQWSDASFFQKSLELDAAAIYRMLSERIDGR